MGMETSPAARILVCEDDELVRRLMVRTLQEEGYLVLEAATGRAAASAANRIGQDLALLVTDVMLPDASGSEVARLVRVHARDVAVLFTSGHSAEAAQGLGISVQPRNFLPKPFSPAELVDHVGAALSGADRPGEEIA